MPFVSTFSVGSCSHVGKYLYCRWSIGRPADAARAKAVLKRQMKAGRCLAGRAAKLKRRADLKARGVDD